MSNIKTRTIPINQLKAAEYNPRKDLDSNDVEWKKINSSMHRFGYVEPIIWNATTGNIVGGHQRFKILKDKGATEVEVVVVDMPEQEEKAANIALNSIEGAWDYGKLQSVLNDLEFSKHRELIDVIGFTEKDLMGICKPGEKTETEEKAVNDEDEKICYGDIITLGRHRLICGSYSDRAIVEKLFAWEKFQMVCADPPYGVCIEKKQTRSESEFNDSMGGGKAASDFSDGMDVFSSYAEDGAIMFIFGCFENMSVYFERIAKFDSARFRVLVWAKNNMVNVGHRKFVPFCYQHEFVFCSWFNSGDSGKRLWYGGYNTSDILSFDKPNRSKEHPTMKPVEMLEHLIMIGSKPGDIVFDPTVGSGSTIIAAENTQRRCFAIEIDPAICVIAKKRYNSVHGIHG